MKKTTSLISGIGAGAALMYMLDPDRGRRRRALMRDKAISGVTETREGLDKTARDMGNRVRGIIANARALFSSGGTSDDILIARVRSRIGRAVSHPHAIAIRTQGSRVTLEGPVLEHELDHLLSAVESVPGVESVENRLQVHKQAGEVPGLQGGGARTGERWELMQTNWTPAVRFLAGVGGAALAYRGLKTGGLGGTLCGLLGGGLLLRAGVNKEFKRIVGVGAGRAAIDIQKTMNIHAPVEEVFNFWANYQNFPRFMTHLKEVRDLGNGRSHWVAAGPAGVSASWDAEITKFERNKTLGWKSLPGSRIENAGLVRFDPNPDGTTRITIRMSYNPPAGMLGHAVAALFGADPKHEIDQDLIRLKSLIEIGKTRARGEMVTREGLSGAHPGRTLGGAPAM